LNEIPGIFKIKSQLLIFQNKVRTAFSKKIFQIFQISAFCQNFSGFYLIYELDCRFEPITSLLLKSGDFVFQNLFLLNQIVFIFLIFLQRNSVFEIGVH